MRFRTAPDNETQNLRKAAWARAIQALRWPSWHQMLWMGVHEFSGGLADTEPVLEADFTDDVG